MRLNLILFITLMACMHVTGKVHAQKVTLNLKNAKLSEVLKQIQKQTGYDPFYDSEQIKTAKRITISVKDVDLDEALESCLKDQPFVYKILNKTIVVSYKSPPPLPKPQKAIIKGKITDIQNKPLVGVSVLIKGTNEGTLTDGNGDYSIQTDANETIVFSHLGYETIEVKINNQTEISLVLVEITNQLSETVIKGYYNTTKELNTGNVSSVKAAELARQPVGDPILALQSRVPGLSIIERSGIPGSKMGINLRGKNSIGNGNDPLFIIDGVPIPSTDLLTGTLGVALSTAGGASPFASIRLEDIESIEVLKDADATAIYGSLGANGVILITTKKGKPGKTGLDVNFYSGAAEISNKLDLMNTQQYLEMRRQAFQNDGATPKATDYDVNGTWDPNRYTDWQEEMFGGTANITDAQAVISGGTASTQFRLSGGYRKETTVFPGDYYNRKGSARLSVNHTSENKRLILSATAGFVNDQNQLAPTTTFIQNILLPPNAPELYNANGSLNWENSTWFNPLRYRTWSSSVKTDNLNGSVNASYELIKGLTVGAQISLIDIKTDGIDLKPLEGQNPADAINPAFRTHQYGGTRAKTWNLEPSLNYKTELGPGKLESLVGVTFQDRTYTAAFQTAFGFASDALIENLGTATTLRVGNLNDIHYRYNAAYARVGYSIFDKYLVNLTGRRDGSSRFGPGRQFGNFGSVAAAWIFSKEKFFQGKIPVITFGKLRASYGITGNDQLTDYRYLSTYSPSNYGNYQDVSGLTPTQLTNPEFGWETVRKLEAALDLGFINDRVMVNLTWYRHRTGNQLVGNPLPDMAGFRNVQANLPAVLENSGLEMEVNSTNISNSKFRWITSFNISIPNSKLISFPNLEASGFANAYAIGESLFTIFKYQYNGIDPVTRLYTFEDINKDGSITAAGDRKKPVFVGQKFFGGLSNSFTYKSFQLDIMLQFVKQNNLLFYGPGVPPGLFLAASPNQLVSVLDESKKGNNSSMQKFTQLSSSPISRANSLFLQSDGALGDASFIRVNNVALSWNLPVKLKQALKLQNAKIYLQGRNLLTFTSYNGIDPGVSTMALPPLRVITAGIQIGL